MAFFNQDAHGNLHFPGFDGNTTRFMARTEMAYPVYDYERQRLGGWHRLLGGHGLMLALSLNPSPGGRGTLNILNENNQTVSASTHFPSRCGTINTWQIKYFATFLEVGTIDASPDPARKEIPYFLT